MKFPFCQYPVCTMLDARKKEVYAALFKWKDGGSIRLISEMSVKVNRALEKINEHVKDVFARDGAILYKNEIVSLMGEKAVFATPEKMVPLPANVACIGIQKALRGEFSEPINLVPFYLRRSEAEMKETDKYR